MRNRTPAKKHGPSVTIRFRSKTELALAKRAARIEGLSLNTFVIGRVAVHAAAVIKDDAALQTAADEALKDMEHL